MHQCPGGEGERKQEPPIGDPSLHQCGKEPERDGRQQQGRPGERRGVEDRDDDDRDEVIHDREGEQEGAQRRRQVGADHSEHGQGEGDIRCGGDGPSAQVVGAFGCSGCPAGERHHAHEHQCR